MPGEITIKLDIPKYVEGLGQGSVASTATFIRRTARGFVRKDTLALMNSARTNQVKKFFFETVFGGPGVPYALAQEYGLPDVPNYGFTPYARPAAALSELDPSVRQDITKASLKAIKDARVRRKAKIK